MSVISIHFVKLAVVFDRRNCLLLIMVSLEKTNLVSLESLNLVSLESNASWRHIIICPLFVGTECPCVLALLLYLYYDS